MPSSKRLWIMAARCEQDVKIKIKILRRALE